MKKGGVPMTDLLYKEEVYAICLSVGLVKASTNRGIDEHKGQNIRRRSDGSL